MLIVLLKVVILFFRFYRLLKTAVSHHFSPHLSGQYIYLFLNLATEN